jgi:hypothetical protein
LKIYFAASIRGGRALQSTYQALVEDLRQSGHTVLSENVAFVTLADDEWTDEAICAQDTAWLDECDAVVAEVTTPSLGVGYEIAYALHHAHKPVLCLCQRSVHLSAMIAGNTHPLLTVLTYDDVPGALRAAHHWLARGV